VSFSYEIYDGSYLTIVWISPVVIPSSKPIYAFGPKSCLSRKNILVPE